MEGPSPAPRPGPGPARLTLTTSPPSTFMSCLRFCCSRLVLDRHFRSPSRSTETEGQSVPRQGCRLCARLLRVPFTLSNRKINLCFQWIVNSADPIPTTSAGLWIRRGAEVTSALDTWEKVQLDKLQWKNMSEGVGGGVCRKGSLPRHPPQVRPGSPVQASFPGSHRSQALNSSLFPDFSNYTRS